VFKQVQRNIPFLDAIQQVPAYVKFLEGFGHNQEKNQCPEEGLSDGASELHPPMQIANQV
jgi:hypothetical protein